MFTTLYIREIQNYLYGLRFQVSFVIVLFVFIIGSVSFVNTLGELQNSYARVLQEQTESMNNQASANISELAVTKRNFITAPRNNSIIADCKEGWIPNSITYSAYNVFDFQVHSGNTNTLMIQADSLSWSFIISMFLSFITLLFAFDAISGEKEDHTLALVFSNPVSRKVFLFSKLASIVTVVTLMALVGIVISLLILTFSGKIQIDSMFLIEIVGFIGVSMLLITVFAVFGLLSSAVTSHSNVSLLISLCFWLFAVVIIPNTSVFWADKLFPIPSAKEIAQQYSEENNDIGKNAPEGSWSSNGGDPFFYRHELRANLQMKLMQCYMKHYDNYYSQMFQQFENTRMFTLLSPIAQFDYINEAFQGGGYFRFRTNWNNLHIYQPQFLQWFKAIDAEDEKSPHWYNPFEDYSTSKIGVSPEQVPRYTEQITSFGQRFEFIVGYLISMITMIVLLFVVCFIFFVKYDVR